MPHNDTTMTYAYVSIAVDRMLECVMMIAQQRTKHMVVNCTVLPKRLIP